MDAKLARLVGRCVADITRRPVENVDVYLEDGDITSWHLALHYPESAPFSGGPGCSLAASEFTLYATLRFHEDFPARPPRLAFESPWTNHQHLWGKRICHSMLTDDFRGHFLDTGTHGTSMWNAACALADGEGTGGMPRYLELLRSFLAADLDYDEEQHVKYDAESLRQDVEAQRHFRPAWLELATRLRGADGEGAEGGADGPERHPRLGPLAAAGPAGPGAALDLEQLKAAYLAAVDGGALEEECLELHRQIMAARSAADRAWGTDFFLKTPLRPGVTEAHPCFDVTVSPGRVPALSTKMATLCARSFDLGARTTDFGTDISALLPYPCSRTAWASVGSKLAAETLQHLAPVAASYRLGLPSDEEPRSSDEADYRGKLEDILGLIGELWKTTCIGIVKDEGYESERAMMCFVTLHFLLLCLADEHPGLRQHAVDTTREFLGLIEGAPADNLKEYVPDLGRFLVRFLLTQDDAPLRAAAPLVVRELFNRNVRWVDPSLWATPEATEGEKEMQVSGTFEASQFGMKLTVFQSYYILRSGELGLDRLPALEACGGRPASEALQSFQADCRTIKELGGFQEFFLWLQLADLAERDPHEMLCAAVDESNARGYNDFGGKGAGRRR
mmetsp:Transcript_38998/g.110172  ORF Transcript_38998/g.110172 Transcript_38998/m.110172 type:complete len:621 (-) Transcript_38998:54-1916(-)